MTRIAINHAIDMKRKKQRQRETVLEPSEFLTISKSDENIAMPLLLREQRELVRNRLDELPLNYRDVIFSYYITEKSYKQIADEQGVEVKTVETKLYRARGWMKRHWKEADF